MRLGAILAAAVGAQVPPRVERCAHCEGTGRAFHAILLPDGECGLRSGRCGACRGEGWTEVIGWL